MKNRLLLSALMLLAVPAVSTAGVILKIDDLLDVMAIVGTSPYGFDPTSLSVQFSAEGVDIHGEYLSTLFLVPGEAVSVNFNFLEALGEGTPGSISDTLNIVFTGHAPIPSDANNISVDLHFRSDVDPTSLPPLTNPFNLTETGSYQDLTSLITANTLVTDFQVSVRSDAVPEPSALMLFLIGAAWIGLSKLRFQS